MTRNLAVENLPRTWVELAARLPKHVVTEGERHAIDSLLKLHGFSESYRAWMVPSCPDLETALRYYPLPPLESP